MEQRLERLTMALEQGAVLLDHDDVNALIEGKRPTTEATEEQQRVDDLAAQLVGDALDTVYSSVDVGGVDLHSPLSPWPEDDYAPLHGPRKSLDPKAQRWNNASSNRWSPWSPVVRRCSM